MKDWFGNDLHFQSLLNLGNCGDTVGAVRVGDGGILLSSVVAEQEYLPAVKGVLGPGDVR